MRQSYLTLESDPSLGGNHTTFTAHNVASEVPSEENGGISLAPTQGHIVLVVRLYPWITQVLS